MKKASFNFPIDPLEAWSAIAGFVVFVGLGFEIGPEAWRCLVTITSPSRDVFGGALVAIGVFAEVAIGIFIARSSRREQNESNELLEATRARLAATEYALVEARAKLVPRSSVFPYREFLGVLMDSKSKGSVEILYPRNDGEANTLARQIFNCFITSGSGGKRWNIRTEPGIILTCLEFIYQT